METPARAKMRRRSAGFDRKYMNRIVKLDLKHIPRGEKGALQNFVRFSYNALRRQHLTLGKSKHETLKEITQKIKKAYPDFIPNYDRSYFKM